LPERQSFNIKYYYYAGSQQYAKAISLLEMWQKLYPSDYYPYYRLYWTYFNQRDFKKAEDYTLKALDIGHRAKSLPRMGRL
ncbi:MAG: hypothetical protein AAFP19_24455, partial [Bacteroidota bacterium]